MVSVNKKKLCVCIPTYNRPDAIQRVLREELELFEQYGIDLFICDSSDNGEIKALVKTYLKGGCSSLFYQKFDSSLSSNEKVFQIFQWGGTCDYSYLWLIHDHTICREESVQFLLQKLDEGFDFYLLNMQADGYRSEGFKDVNTFLMEGAWRLNSFGASVVNTKTFLQDVNWEKIWRKYGDGKTLNYSHIGFYFERAAEIENFKSCQVFFDRKDFLDFFRTQEISWRQDTLRICLECWGEVISRLPDIYTNKIQVMRTQDKWFLSKYSLLIYKKDKRYGLITFLRYRKWIRKIYPEDYIRDFFISILPIHISLGLYTGKLSSQINRMKKKGGMVYIFGAGRHAAECAVFLDACGIAYDGFVVTKLEGNPKKLKNHVVYQASKALKGRRSLVVVAVLSSGVSGVLATLASLKDHNTVIETITFAT